MRASANLVGPQLDVGLHNSILKLAANKTLGVEDRVRGVHGNLHMKFKSHWQYNDESARHMSSSLQHIQHNVTNQALSVRECDVGRRGTVALWKEAWSNGGSSTGGWEPGWQRQGG
eukprot:325071-Chlamydomonas_euryale.AAC.7